MRAAEAAVIAHPDIAEASRLALVRPNQPPLRSRRNIRFYLLFEVAAPYIFSFCECSRMSLAKCFCFIDECVSAFEY